MLLAAELSLGSFQLKKPDVGLDPIVASVYEPYVFDMKRPYLPIPEPVPELDLSLNLFPEPDTSSWFFGYCAPKRKPCMPDNKIMWIDVKYNQDSKKSVDIQFLITVRF